MSERNSRADSTRLRYGFGLLRDDPEEVADDSLPEGTHHIETLDQGSRRCTKSRYLK